MGCQERGAGVSREGEDISCPPNVPPCLPQLKSYGEKLDKEQAALEKVEAKADPR